LDFVNAAEEILAAFQPYFQTTLLEEATDPNKLYDLQTELEAFEVYTDDDVDEFAEIFYTPNVPLENLQPILDRVVMIWGYKPEPDREDFRSRLQKFIRLYGFISQIITFEDVDLEKLYVFSKALNRKLPRRKISPPYEIRESVDLDSFRLQETYSGSIELLPENGGIPGYKGGIGGQVEEERDLLSYIIKSLNETYGVNLSEEDKVDMQLIRSRLEENESLRDALLADNPRSAKEYKFSQVLDKLLLEFVHTKLDLYKKLTDPRVNQMLKRQWFEVMTSES